MDIAQILDAIKQAQPTLTAVADTGTALVTIGGWAVNVFQAGKKANTFRIRRSTKGKGGKNRTPTDVALVIDVTWSIAPHVLNFLRENKIDAEMLLMVNNQQSGDGRWLNSKQPKEWEDAVHDFSAVMKKIRMEMPSAQVHIFIASPVALAFAMGAAWGTVYRATVYHWDSDHSAYFPVIKTSTRLKDTGT